MVNVPFEYWARPAAGGAPTSDAVHPLGREVTGDPITQTLSKTPVAACVGVELATARPTYTVGVASVMVAAMVHATPSADRHAVTVVPRRCTCTQCGAA